MQYQQTQTQFQNTGSALVLRRSSVTIFFIALFIIGIHTRLSVYASGAIIVPMYLCVFSGCMLAMLHLKQMMRQLLKPYFWLALFLLLIIPNALLSNVGFMETFKATLQLLLSLALFGILLQSCRTCTRQQLFKLFFTIWLSFVCLALLERFLLFDIFNELTRILYSGSPRMLYESIERDIMVYGNVRPRVFATEPSFLAFTMYSLSAALFTLHRKPGSQSSYILLGTTFAVSLLVNPSLTSLFFILAVMVWQFWPRNAEQKSMIFMGFLMLAVFVIIFPWLWNLGSDAIAQIGGRHIESGSFYGRVVVGPSVTCKALLQRPVLGFGVGGESGVGSIILGEWITSGAFARFPWFLKMRINDLMTNGFYWYWVYFGLVGGGAFALLILNYARNLGSPYPLRTLICGWIIWQSGGAVVDAASWFAVAVFEIGAICGQQAAQADTQYPETDKQTSRTES